MKGRGGGRGGPGMQGGAKVVVLPHKHDVVFIAKAKEDALCTKNMVVGESAYSEKSYLAWRWYYYAILFYYLYPLHCPWKYLHAKEG
ncbi:hypothetical protein ACQJBY_062639 [Aegilops geniculata]